MDRVIEISPLPEKGGIGLKGPLAEKGFNAQTDFKALGS